MCFKKLLMLTLAAVTLNCIYATDQQLYFLLCFVNDTKTWNNVSLFCVSDTNSINVVTLR